MLQLVCAKLCAVARKLGIILAEIFELTRIVTVDFSLDGVGASERRFFGHQRGCCAKRETRDIPQWLERGRANPPFGHQPVEPAEMPLLLSRHSRNELGFRAIGPEHRELSRIDSRRSIFAGLVDPKHRRRVSATISRAPGRHARLPLNDRSRISAAPPSERIAFHPAIEIPRKRNCTSSQRTRGAWVNCFRSSAVLAPFVSGVAVH